MSFHWNLTVDPIRNVSDPYCVQAISACAGLGASESRPTRLVKAKEATEARRLDRGRIVEIGERNYVESEERWWEM